MFSMFRNLLQLFTNVSSSTWPDIRFVSTSFKKAADIVKRFKQEPNEQQQLKLYALYKQAKYGSCKIRKPITSDVVSKCRFEAWKSLGSMSKKDAEKAYIQLVEKMVKEIGLKR